MSLKQEDFLIRGCDGADAATFDTWVGGNIGTAQIHAELSNPLVGEGTYCRKFVVDDATAQQSDYTVTFFALNSTTDGGLWTNNLVNYAYSLRAWVRVQGDTNNADTTAVGVFCGYPNFSEGICGANDKPLTRFALLLRPINADAQVRLVDDTAAEIFDLAGTVALATVQADTWHRIRLDVIPTSDYYILKSYTGTGNTGSETWTLIDDRQTTPGTSTGTLQNAHVGFYAYTRCTNSGATYRRAVYIDSFVALGEDLTS